MSAGIREQLHELIDQSGEPSDYELGILAGLQLKDTYQGTVDPVTIAERRARNRAARRSRRGNTAALIRQARSNRPRRGFAFRRTELPVVKFLGGEA